MEIKNARLIKICDAQEGVSKAGNPWRKVTAVLETTEHFPKTIAVTCFNSVCETVTQFSPGSMLNVTFDVESRCWVNPDTNVERWFTEATARIIVPAVATAQTAPTSFDNPIPPLNQPKATQTSIGIVPPTTDDPTNDLPF